MIRAAFDRTDIEELSGLRIISDFVKGLMLGICDIYKNNICLIIRSTLE